MLSQRTQIYLIATVVKSLRKWFLMQHLKWDKQSEMQKIFNILVFLKRARLFVLRHTLIKVYNVFCTVINKLSKLQRRAARVITSSTYDIPSSEILKDLNRKLIEVDLQNRETVMTFKTLTGIGPGYLQQLLIECNNVSTA